MTSANEQNCCCNSAPHATNTSCVSITHVCSETRRHAGPICQSGLALHMPEVQLNSWCGGSAVLQMLQATASSTWQAWAVNTPSWLGQQSVFFAPLPGTAAGRTQATRRPAGAGNRFCELQGGKAVFKVWVRQRRHGIDSGPRCTRLALVALRNSAVCTQPTKEINAHMEDGKPV